MEYDASKINDVKEEIEERRKRMLQILAEKAVAKAIEAIKERENNVAKLEGENRVQRRYLEEQEKQEVLKVSFFVGSFRMMKWTLVEILISGWFCLKRTSLPKVFNGNGHNDNDEGG